MKRHVRMLLVLAAVVLLPWTTQAQLLSDYTFATGVDATKWVASSDATWTTIVSSGQDDGVSTLQNIGFTFFFGEESYTQFSANTNGIFKLGSPVTTNSWGVQFNSSYYNINLPKICGVSRDLSSGAAGYVRFATVGTAPNRILVCEYSLAATSSTSATADVNWQVQLHETSNLVELVYNGTPASTPSSFQIGMSTATNDIRVVNPSSHTSSHSTAAVSTTYSVWPGSGRYYSFSRPVITCPAPQNFAASSVTADFAVTTWTAGGTETSWQVSNGTTATIVNTPSYTFTGLTANTNYTFSVRGICGAGDTSNWRSLSLRTQCAAMDSLPYTYGFEGLTTTSSTARPVIPCWNHLNDGTQYFGYPYISSTAHTGTRSLYWYNSTSVGSYGSYQCVVLPAVDTILFPLSTLQLKFWAKASSTSYYPIFQVGVMTDPGDISTFQLVKTIQVGNSAQWDEFAASFVDFDGYGQYVALRAISTSGSWYAYTDDFTLQLAPQCPPIVHMSAVEVGNTGALITWEDQGGTLGTPQEYDIEYFEVGGTASPTTLSDTLPQIFLSGLDTNTTYRVRVRANCWEYDYGDWDSITFTTTGSFNCLVIDNTTQNTINFSNGTSTSSGTLVYSGYGNTMYQTIYTAAELNAAGIFAGGIAGVDFGFAANTTYAKEFTIFMGTTTRNSFSSSTDYVNPGTLQQVYGPDDYPTHTSAGWRHFDFDEAFSWDGVSNIIVCTFMNQPTGSTHTSSSFTGYYTSAFTGASLYRYKDSNPFTLANYTTSTGGSTSSYRASTHFYVYGCSQSATCAAPMVRAERVAAREIDIAWAAGFDETAWDITYRVAGATAWDTAATGVTSRNYTFLNLTPATSYQICVSHYCTTDDTLYATLLDVVTPCEPYTIPFTENFDSYVASSTSQLGPCWNKYYNSGTHTTTSYPYPYSSYHHSGSNSLYFYGYNDTYCNWLVLPEFADSIRTLELSFWEYKTTASYGLVEIGVITDPEDLTTFVPVDTVQASSTSTWEHFFVNFVNYEGPEGRIALVGRTSSSYYFYIDDIEVGRYSTCPRVQNLAATRLTNDSAYVSWSSSENPTGYRVWWSSTNNFNAATDSLDVTNPTVAFGGLGPNTTVHLWVSQFCQDNAMSSPVHLVFTTAANCEVITDLYIHNVTATSAVFTWNEPQSGYAATWYRVSWQTTAGVVTDSTPNPFYFLTGLDTASSYTFSVVAFCPHAGDLDSSFAVSRTFTTSDGICNYIAGLGSSTTSSTSPLYVTKAYYYGHMLFFAEELAQMGDTITSLTFNVTTSGSITRNVDVYLGNSDYENMYTPTFPAYSTLTQVYSGNWTVSNGQCTINFTTPFVRNHSRNLVVGIDDNTGTANSSAFSFTAAATTDRNTGDNIYTVHFAGTDADVNPATDDAINVTYVRPVVTFGTTCASESCSSPAAIAYGGTDSTINLIWNANSGSAWRVEYRLPTDTVWTVADSNVTTNNYVLSGLRVATRYAIRVGSICSADNILFTPIFGETACGDALVPYTDDFNDIVNGWYERTCWRVGTVTGAARIESNTTSNYPRVVNLTQYGPMLRLYDGAYAVMPHFAEPLHNLQVRFDYLTPFTAEAYTLFGYLTNPDDINSLVVIDTLRHHPTVEGVRLYTIDLDQLADDADGNLCFVTPHTINYTHIDNIMVDLIPPCAIPDSLTLISAIDTTADLQWYMSNIGSATYMVRYSAYRSGVYDTVFSSTTSVTLNGLIPGTTYDAECYSICLRTGDTSLASNVCRFTTDCAPLPTLPYFLTFEDVPLSTTQTLPNCWEIPQTNTTESSSLPHCVFDNPNAAAGYYYVYVTSQSTMAMPEFIAPPDSLQISFYMKTASAGDQVAVGVIDTMSPFAFTAVDTFTTSGTGYQFFSAYMVGYTGPGTRIGIRTLSNSAVYIDNLTIDYAPTCLPVRNLRAATATASTVTLAWRDLTAAAQYQIEYGNAGFTRGTGTTAIVTTNPVTILGLSPMTNYDFYVRPICSVGDTAEWSSVLHASTALCDNLVTIESWDSAWTATTHSYGPMGSGVYNYGYVQTIIDSARFVDLEAEITAFAFNPAVSTAGDRYNHMDVYMANVSESNLSAGFIMPDSNHHFVQVLNDADLSYSTVGWQMHSFDTAFVWDGHSNVLFVVNRRHGSYTSGGSFNAHSTSAAKTRYLYTDGSAYDPATVTGGTTASVVGDLQFFSCAAACDRPDIASVTGDYQSATLTWVGTGTTYEVSYRTSLDTNWTAPVSVTGSSYTFTGLMPLTHYELRVRQDCTADSIGFSAWISTTFMTDSLPCPVPDSLAVTDVTNATATFAWLSNGDETSWNIHVWNTAYDSVYTVSTNPATIGGLTAGVTYNAAIRALCGGSAAVAGEWSDPITFSTATCPQVTGLATSDVTFNSVTLTWTAVTGAQSYRVSYESGQLRDSVVVTTNSYTYTGLQSDRQYTFYVRTVCGDNWYSETYAQVTARTAEEPEDAVTLTVAVNDPSMGYVTINGSQTTTYTGVAGDVVTLAAQAYEGYAFVSWSDGNAEATRSYTLPEADATLTATFRAEEGIDDVAGARCTLYPNPAKGTTTVTVTGISGKVRIAVLDLSGREVLGRELSIVNCQFSISLDLEGLAEGAYFVRITSEANAPLVRKLIVR